VTMSHAWGYSAENGPEKWVTKLPHRRWVPASPPSTIVPADASYDAGLKPLCLKYDAKDCIDILNNGHSFQNDMSCILIDCISWVYRLKQFHFHWGVTGAFCPSVSQLHLVHWNTKYPSFGEAASKSDGLAVVGVFLKLPSSFIHASRPPTTTPPCSLFSCRFPSQGTQTTFPGFDPTTLLPGCLDYWTYDGSLTTPPLLESVTWIVCKETISVSPAQMASFRALQFSGAGEAACCMVDNYRPPQPLKGRAVKASFQ
uniref:carbonic anhydrase n=1 Tax=Gadus morhua TaxID=8049 RepID=A0A8C5AI36_GADMO